MIDYEALILARQEMYEIMDDDDDYYFDEEETMEEHYNPVIQRMLAENKVDR